MRRYLLLFASTAVMLTFALLGSQPRARLLLLDWSSRAQPERAPVTVLIEMGLKDKTPTSWSGQATVEGARVVGREGYRFIDDDRLTEPASWTASSHRAVRPVRRRPRAQPTAAPTPPSSQALAAQAAARLATVGVVLHLD